jgi:sugar (pentulose or hexulose) kinase
MFPLQVMSLATSRGGVDRLRKLLGPVQLNGGTSLGPVGAHLVNNFGFSSGCIVAPFTTATAASSLAHPLCLRPSTPSGTSAIVCLSVEDDDLITIPTTEFVAGVDWAAIPNPVRDFTDQAAYVHDQTNYLISIT